MFDSLVDARRTLDEISVAFDASVLSPQAAERVVDELAWIRNVVDAMIAKTAKRVAETSERDGARASHGRWVWAEALRRPRSTTRRASSSYLRPMRRCGRDDCPPAKRR